MCRGGRDSSGGSTERGVPLPPSLILWYNIPLFSLDESDSDDDDEILDDDEPDMDTVMIQHSGAVNRIRVISPLL